MQITLSELLDARESRARMQKELILKHKAPLICFTMNVAGPTKTSPSIERAFSEGARQIREKISPYSALCWLDIREKSGPVLFSSVSAPPKKLKALMVEIEEGHPLGRLFDIDVLDTDGKKITRECERGCIVCGAAGRACAAGRLHPLSDIVNITDKMIRDFFADTDAQRIAELAKKSLIDEVYTHPKPGLVDTESRGSHTDMDVSHFEKSAEALTPYFAECVRAGIIHKDEPKEIFFNRIRRLGIEAEMKMYEATGGVNTHKGIIFSMGIITSAVGRLITQGGEIPSAELILSEAGKIAESAVKRDFEALDGSTAGGRLYLESGIRGIRGEAMDGFPSVKNIALPAYKSAISDGKNKNDAGALTLLHLIASVYDTSLYNRGGKEGVAYAQMRARELISRGEPALDEIRKLDVDFTEKNLSPGGCADLLAITYFLTELETGL